jgi:hypothetical protein
MLFDEKERYILWFEDTGFRRSEKKIKMLAVALRNVKSQDRLDIRLGVYNSVSYVDIERHNSELFYKAISIMEVVSNR